MEELDILTLENAISVTKENKTSVNYFIFDEYEIHLNVIPSGTVQEWHKHSTIEEVIVVLSGKITLKWLSNGEPKTTDVFPNTVIRVRDSVHTLENNTDSDASFIVYRMVLDGKSKKDIIKNDKIVYDVR